MNPTLHIGFLQSSAIGRVALCLLCLLLTTTVCSCASEGTESAEKTVTWPELTQLDAVVIRAARSANAGDIAAVSESRPDLLEAGRAVSAPTIPSNAADRQRVQALLADLTSLIDSLADEPDDETLVAIVLGLHPVIENLMEAAGMPHVHMDEGAEHDHDSDHHDHDHGDDHHDHGDHGDGAEPRLP